MRKKLIDHTLEEWMEATSSPDPNPGGGGICAFVAATSGCLTEMVYQLSQGKKKYEALDASIRDSLTDQIGRLREINEKLKIYMEEDGHSFDGVLEALRLPKDGEEAIRLRDEKIQKGYRHAIEIPFKIADLSLEALTIARKFADYGSLTAITDIAISGLMLQAAVEGVLYNVTINLKGITDNEYGATCRRKQDFFLRESHRLKKEIVDVIKERMGI